MINQLYNSGMAEIKGDLTKLKKGERLGSAALIVCAVITVLFAICFTIGKTKDIKGLYLAALIAAPVLLAFFAAVAAFSNVRFGGKIDKITKAYIKDVFLENAALLKPEKESLSFYITFEGACVNVNPNSFKEGLRFDFSPLLPLSSLRKLFILSEIENLLILSFMGLYSRGAKFKEVGWVERSAAKSKKPTYIIFNGEPDKKAYKKYLKLKA